MSVVPARAAPTGLFLRRLRLEPAPALAVLALLGFTCFLFAALPRFFNDVADRGLRHMVEHSPPLAANARVLETGRVPGDALGERTVHSRGALPLELRELAGDSTFVARSGRYVLQDDYF